MTDTIPEDVLYAAREAVALLNEPGASMTGDAFAKNARRGEFDHWDIVKAAVRAIFAERERCAKVAEMFRISICDEDYDLGATDTAENIADAIRKGGSPASD